MIVEVPRKYNTYRSLFMEADNEIEIKPHKSRGTDYSAIEPEPDASDNVDDVDADDYTDDEKKDTNDDNPKVLDEDDGGDTDYTATDDADNNDGDDATTSDADNDNTNDGGNDDASVLDEDDGGDTDYTATDGDTDKDTTDDSETDDKDGDNISENMKKYNLFKQYMNMNTTIESFVDRLQKVTKDSLNINSAINTAINKLYELKDVLYEYMLYKFKTSSYMESLLFYENISAATKQILFYLENTCVELKQ